MSCALGDEGEPEYAAVLRRDRVNRDYAFRILWSRSVSRRTERRAAIEVRARACECLQSIPPDSQRPLTIDRGHVHGDRRDAPTMRRKNLYAAYRNAVPQPCSCDILYFLSLVAETLRTFGVLMLLAKILRDRRATGNGFVRHCRHLTRG